MSLGRLWGSHHCFSPPRWVVVGPCCLPCAPSWPPGVQPELLRVMTSTDAPHFSPAWFWEVCVHTSCPNSFVSGLQPRHPDPSSSQHQRCLPEPSIQDRRPSVISTQRGYRGRAAAERFQASGQYGPGGGELVTGSQMLETKRTCRHTPHSSIPPCEVGPFPGAYVLFPSDCKGSFLQWSMYRVRHAWLVLPQPREAETNGLSASGKGCLTSRTPCLSGVLPAASLLSVPPSQHRHPWHTWRPPLPINRPVSDHQGN